MAFDPEEPEMIQVGNFLIDEARILGQGNFGKVYLSQEIPDDFDTSGMVPAGSESYVTTASTR